MPKIIPELRSAMIQSARKSLLESESHTISMRQLAEECGTAVGTVYNYFPSKEALIAEAMMIDWLECSRDMREKAAAEHHPLKAVQATAVALRKFTSLYAPMWKQDANQRKRLMNQEIRHSQIIAEIADAVKETLIRFDLMYDIHLPEIIAELVLLASRTDDGFDRIAPVMAKILG